jgi:hypothetical protein
MHFSGLYHLAGNDGFDVDGFDVDFFTDEVGAVAAPLPLMPQPAAILSLSQLEKLPQARFISHDKKRVSAGPCVKMMKKSKKHDGDEAMESATPGSFAVASVGPHVVEYGLASSSTDASTSDDESFNIEDAAALLLNLSTEVRLKRSHAGNSDVTLTKKRMLAVGVIGERLAEEDMALFAPHPEVTPAFVNFLFQFNKKFEAFKKLFILQDGRSTAYTILTANRFTLTQMIQVLANNGGYKNLEALQALTVKAADQDQTPLQQLKAAGFEPTHIVSILANNGGYKNLEALLNFIPYYVGLTAPEKTAFLSFVSKAGASTRVALAKRLIELHTDKIDKASLFDFLKNATNKSAVQFEALPLEQLVEQIKPKKAKRVPAGRPQTQTAVAVPIYPFVEGAFGGLAGVPGYNPDAIPKVPDGGQEVVAAQTAEV